MRWPQKERLEILWFNFILSFAVGYFYGTPAGFINFFSWGMFLVVMGYYFDEEDL